MGNYKIGKNLSKKDHWSNFVNGFIDALVILIFTVLLLCIAYLTSTMIFWLVNNYKVLIALLIILFIAAINGLVEVIKCKYIY